MNLFSYPSFIARRYLWAKRKNGFISIISIISMAGVALGTAALIITLCIISGFENQLITKFINFDAHIRLKTFDGTEPIGDTNMIEEQLQGYKSIIGFSPYIEKEAMIRSSQITDGVIVKGINEQRFHSVLDLKKDILKTHVSVSTPLGLRDYISNDSTSKKLPGIVIGKKLADKLAVGIGDKLTLFSLQNSPSFLQQPVVRQYRVTAIYRSGLAEYDNVYVYVDLTEASKLFDYGASVSGYEIKLNDPESAKPTAEALNGELGFPYYAKTWYDNHRNLFGWLETNNFIMVIIFSLIIFVAAFNIVGTLFMIVIEKTKEIGVLRSMGATRSEIRRIFLAEGLIIGFIGAVVGSILALALMLSQIYFKWLSLDSDVYFMDSVPMEIRGEYFFVIASFSVLLCLLATLYPSRKAAFLDPVEAVRYE